MRSAFVITLVACGAPAKTAAPPPAPQVVETDEFRLLMPAGYQNLTAAYQAQEPDIRAAFSGKDSRGEVVAIIFERVQVPTWIVEPARCEEHARMVVYPRFTGGPREGSSKLRSATVIDWAGAKACEIDFVTDTGGPTLATDRLDPVDPEGDGWMLLCQHNDDTTAISVCRATRDSLVMKKQPR